jgi:hypothetical protein
MRVFGGAQHKLILFQNVDEARIAADGLGNNFDNVLKHGMEGIGSRHPASNVMQKIDITRVFGFSCCLFQTDPPCDGR